MNLRFFILIFIIVAISCDKTDESIRKDQILFTDIQPDTLVTVIDSLKYNEIYTGESCISHVYASPDNYYEFDLNDDGTPDYRISHGYSKSYNETWSPHNPCDSVFGFSILIEALNGENRIIADTSRYIWYPIYAVMELDTSSLITSSLPSDTAAYLYFTAPYMFGFIPVNPNVTVGLILSTDNNMLCGWLALTAKKFGFTVKEYAVNLTEEKEIFMGQKENSD